MEGFSITNSLVNSNNLIFNDTPLEGVLSFVNIAMNRFNLTVKQYSVQWIFVHESVYTLLMFRSVHGYILRSHRARRTLVSSRA